MIKYSDKNKLVKFDYNVNNQKNEIIELDSKNSLISENVKNYSFSFDVLHKKVKIDTDWETLDFNETLRYQYKFWEIDLGTIDSTLLPFILIDVLTENNIYGLVAKINKIFSIDEDNIKLKVGIYFSEYSEMEQYNPIDVKLLIYFNNIPLVKKQNLNPGDYFINIPIGGGVGG